MSIANKMPKFLNEWNSKSWKEKKQLKIEFTEVAGKNGNRMSDDTFFRKKKVLDFSELEKEWWAVKLGLSKHELFN